uniref:Ras and EF-hand domain-containing protein homolog n=1 Tax=Schistocephalus solidus TaxID=70667 RepID=A0A0V0J9M3_SCHSO
MKRPRKKLEQLEISYNEAAQKKEDLDNERIILERRLEETELNLKDCQEYIEVLSKKARDERRSRARAAMELSEGIALERETLVRQLNELRETNRRLRDERDEGLLRRSSFNQRSNSTGESLYAAMQLVSQGQTTVDGYGRMTAVCPNLVDRPDRFAANVHHGRRGSTMDTYFSQIPTGALCSTGEGSIIEEEEAGDEFTDDVSDSVFSSRRKRSHLGNSARNLTDRSPRPSPDGAIDQATIMEDAFSGSGPERVFKVISIGNSGVGKTSILQMFVTGTFSQSATTIGVDVQVKPMKVDGTSVVLQLWDTAGQERYRSITTQYFRKADGVVLVYDLTSEMSFLQLRGWMQNVADGVDPGTPVMLLANKADLLNENVPANVTFQAGERFAKEYEALYFQVSAKTGENIDRAFEALVRCLKQQEDKRFNDLLTFKMPVLSKKKACCMN